VTPVTFFPSQSGHDGFIPLRKAGFLMEVELMAKLIEIERAAGYADALHIRRMTMEAQHLLLDWQRRYADSLAKAATDSVTDRTADNSDLTRRLPNWSDTSRRMKHDAQLDAAIPALHLAPMNI
jgi:hypothetical protein